MTRIVDDDEAEIEAEIQKELDSISAENLEIEDLEEDLSSFEDKNEDITALPESLEEYLKFVQSRSDGVQQEVNECDAFLHVQSSESSNQDDEILAQKIKEALGEDCHGNPLDIRNKVLSEIQEAEEKEQQEKLRRASSTNGMALDIIRPDISENVRLLEEKAEKQLQELEEKQFQKNLEKMELYNKMKIEENERQEKKESERKQRQEQLEAAKKLLTKNQMLLQEKIENEMKEKEEKLSILQQEFQKEINEMEEEKEKEKKALNEIQHQKAENQRIKQNQAAIRIQKTFRGYRVYVKHKEILEQRRIQRIQRHEEELERKYQEEIQAKQEEERKRVEEERIQKEQQWRDEMEKKRKEEERIKDEQKKQEEEKKKRMELEDQKRCEEDERKRKEEERQRKEEEHRLKNIEEKKKKEEERKEEQKRIMEMEKRKQQEEEEKKRIEEERKRIEEEQRLKKMKEERKEQERKEEEERKKLDELKKKKEEEGERRIKEEEKKKEEELERKLAEETQFEAKRKEFEEIQRKQKDKEKQEEQKQNEELIKKQKANQTILDEERGYLVNLEERRTKWQRDHKPWSSTTYEDRIQPVAKMKARQRPRRPFSASKGLPSLTKEQLLKTSLPGTSLQKVVKVSLSSCPACSMHGLDCCPGLKTLTMTDCGLKAAEGLDECKELQELRLQNNSIEHINIRDLHQLDEVLLSNNSLTSVQGLHNCTRLRHLDLTNNRITRIGDLSTCPNLQRLSLDNNQLIMTKGLSNLTRLQSLCCTSNHLPNVKEVDYCQLLQVLNLVGNNLQKPPLLTNHVLLRELWLDDNSVSNLEPLASAWLPSLHLLSVSQNSVSTIDSLDGLVVLHTLDVSHNLISDIDSLIPGLIGCKQLQTLKITGNPVNEEPQCRKTITDTISSLTQLDDEVFHCKSLLSAANLPSFVAMCLRQQKEHDNMISRHTEQMSSINEDTTDPQQVLKRLNIKNQHFEEMHQQAVAHLHEHEQFGVDNEEKSKDCNQQEVVRETHAVNNSVETKMEKLCDNLVQSENERKTSCINKNPIPQRETRKITEERIRNKAAVKIQALWRGWYIRHLIDIQTKRWLAAVTIQTAWRGYSVRSKNKQKSRVSRARKALWDIRHDAAATTIQACYRGYRVRHRLTLALQSLNRDSFDEDDFNYDEEVDLSAFDFDLGVLDDGWTPTDTPQLPSRGPALPNTGPAVVPSKSKQIDTHQPRQAWRSADSPMELDLMTNRRRVPPIPKQSAEQDLMSVTSGKQSHMTNQVEEMSNEWGLKNAETAELMWKRANRMKYNPARKRKLLDPAKRLALFKKLDEANKLREVKPPPKRQTRLDYFAVRDANVLPSGSSTPISEREVKAQMTYSWVHSQGVVHEDQKDNYIGQEYTTPTKNKKPTKGTPPQAKASVNLPQLDAVQLTGRNVPLVSSPALILEQISKNSTPRRNSSVLEEIHFPPIKTYSVPNLAARSTVSGSSERTNEKSNSAGARMTNERRERR